MLLSSRPEVAKAADRRVLPPTLPERREEELELGRLCVLRVAVFAAAPERGARRAEARAGVGADVRVGRTEEDATDDEEDAAREVVTVVLRAELATRWLIVFGRCGCDGRGAEVEARDADARETEVREAEARVEVEAATDGGPAGRGTGAAAVRAAGVATRDAAGALLATFRDGTGGCRDGARSDATGFASREAASTGFVGAFELHPEALRDSRSKFGAAERGRGVLSLSVSSSAVCRARARSS